VSSRNPLGERVNANLVRHLRDKHNAGKRVATVTLEHAKRVDAAEAVADQDGIARRRRAYRVGQGRQPRVRAGRVRIRQLDDVNVVSALGEFGAQVGIPENLAVGVDRVRDDTAAMPSSDRWGQGVGVGGW
jgi:hypothetical protein